MPLIRVVIPTYNRCKLAREAIESALDQTVRDLEIVVVDDGSADTTNELLREFERQDRRVTGVWQRNQGVACARNRAIEVPGLHRYVAFLDSADLWVPSHLERAIEALERNPEVSLAFARRQVVDTVGIIQARGATQRHERRPEQLLARAKPSGDRCYVVPATECRRGLLRNTFAPWTSSVVVRRASVLRTPWFKPHLEVMEDLDLYLYLAEGSFAFLDEVHGLYRYAGDNLTSGDNPGSPVKLRQLHSVLEYQKTKLTVTTAAGDRAYVKSEIAETLWLIGQGWDLQSNSRRARSAYASAFNYRPSWKATRSYFAVCLHPGVRRVLRNLLASLGDGDLG